MKAIKTIIRKIFNESLDKVNDSLKNQMLINKLLKLGGKKVLLTIEEDIDKLILNGKLYNEYEIKVNKMKPSKAHANAGVFWYNYSEENGTDSVKIVTGYGLSDGQWHSHSWVILPKFKILVETTVKRDMYFGVELNENESFDFYDNNY